MKARRPEERRTSAPGGFAVEHHSQKHQSSWTAFIAVIHRGLHFDWFHTRLQTRHSTQQNRRRGRFSGRLLEIPSMVTEHVSNVRSIDTYTGHGYVAAVRNSGMNA